MSLLGVIVGTIITTLGIFNKQTIWIILGFVVMILSILGLGWTVYS